MREETKRRALYIFDRTIDILIALLVVANFVACFYLIGTL